MSSSDIISQIRSISKSQWQSLRRTDQTRLSGERHYVQQILAKKTLELEEKDRQILERFFSRFSDALENSLIPFAESLKCEFPDELPITQKIPEIKDALANHQGVIVCGATGSGKTTQLPKAALSYGLGRHGRIGCTQPRRIAASALASRFAQECDAQLGKAVGYKVRFDDHTSNNTVVKFMTDGILLAETRDDPNLLQYECVILDEVHERSLNIDFLLGYMKILLSKRQDFRLIVSSATLE